MNMKIDERPFKNWGSPNEVCRSSDFEDDFVINYFSDKQIDRRRLVVDIGAADGITASNSFKLINKYKWRGILIEPFSTFYNFLKEFYVDNTDVIIHKSVCDTKNSIITLNYSDDPSKVGLSSIYSHSALEHNLYKKELVEGKRFKELVSDSNIDFLSLDTEGNDFVILKDIDFINYNIEVICCERWVGHDDDYNNLIINFLSEKNYTVSKITSGNMIFTKK